MLGPTAPDATESIAAIPTRVASLVDFLVVIIIMVLLETLGKLFFKLLIHLGNFFGTFLELFWNFFGTFEIQISDFRGDFTDSI
jgi:hypothetical protein